jgi:hypothetical protein
LGGDGLFQSHVTGKFSTVNFSTCDLEGFLKASFRFQVGSFRSQVTAPKVEPLTKWLPVPLLGQSLKELSECFGVGCHLFNNPCLLVWLWSMFHTSSSCTHTSSTTMTKSTTLLARIGFFTHLLMFEIFYSMLLKEWVKKFNSKLALNLCVFFQSEH